MADGQIATVEARPALTPLEVLNNAIERGIESDALEKLMELQERWERNIARKAFDEAISAAKAEIPPITRNRRVGYESKKAGGGSTEYSHEDFAQVARTVDPVLSKHGLSYRFRTASPADGPVSVTCIISHRLGYSEENSLQAPRDQSGSKNPIQAIGSTVTYLQRYTLKAALGLASADTDDDGRAAGGDAPVNDEQRKAILDKIDETGADIDKFCAYMKVDAVPDIRARDYDRAMAALTIKGKAKAQ